MGSRISINTDKMELYADRLNALNRRLDNLDCKMDRLYFNVGVFEIGKLYRADSLISYSRKIRKCADYCENTARLFENAEKKIAKKNPLTYQGFPTKKEISLFLKKLVGGDLTSGDIISTVAKYAGIDEASWYVQLATSKEPVQTIIELAGLEDTAWEKILNATDDYIDEFKEWYTGGPLVVVTGTIDLLFDSVDYVYLLYEESWVAAYMKIYNCSEEAARAEFRHEDLDNIPSEYAKEYLSEIPVIGKYIDDIAADYTYVYETSKYVESTLGVAKKLQTKEIVGGNTKELIDSYEDETYSYLKNTREYYAYKYGLNDSFTWTEYERSDGETISALIRGTSNGKALRKSGGGGGSFGGGGSSGGR